MLLLQLVGYLPLSLMVVDHHLEPNGRWGSGHLGSSVHHHNVPAAPLGNGLLICPSSVEPLVSGVVPFELASKFSRLSAFLFSSQGKQHRQRQRLKLFCRQYEHEKNNLLH